MKRWFLIMVMLAFMSGCYTYRIREFVAFRGAETFENWRIHVTVQADLYPMGSYSPGNHNYSVSCTASTVKGDVYYGASSYRTSAYFARFDSLKLTYLQGDVTVELPLDSLHRGKRDEYSRSIYLSQKNLIAIPEEVRELEATVTMTFSERKKTSKTETKVFNIRMIKKEGRKIAPITV